MMKLRIYLQIITGLVALASTPVEAAYHNLGAFWRGATVVSSPWTTMTTGPAARSNDCTLSVGGKMIIWGGYDASYTSLNTGDIYDPVTNSWSVATTSGAPQARETFACVSTGTKMVVWGGRNGNTYQRLNDGGIYDLATDTWVATSTTGVPTARNYPRGVWANNKVVVWGGQDAAGFSGNYLLNEGAIFDPATNSWSAMSTAGAPGGRWESAVLFKPVLKLLSGVESPMAEVPTITTAPFYNPSTDTWTSMTTTGASAARRNPNRNEVWSGSRMIIWGGTDTTAAYINSGGRYDPDTNTWAAMSTTGAPTGRTIFASAPAGGNKAFFWGGRNNATTTGNNDGGIYDVVNDSWISLSLLNAPSNREIVNAVKIGTRILVWGGRSNGTLLASGAAYSDPVLLGPAPQTWVVTSAAGAPVPRQNHTAVWTGSKMIVWGGHDSSYNTVNTGGVYDPVTNSWTPTTTTGAPPAVTLPDSIWTGSKMIVWGGSNMSFNAVNTGGIYDPAADSWTSTSTGAGVPSPRTYFSIVWTGTKMLIWGGNSGMSRYGDGSAFDPALNSWSPISSSGAPSARTLHAGVWNGSRMVIFGGASATYTDLNDGGQYILQTTPGQVLRLRVHHHLDGKARAVAVGSKIVIWGGQDSGGGMYNSGGVYDPVGNSWTSTTMTNVPSARQETFAVSTGTQMIIWGGNNGGSLVNSGGIYDLAGNTWTATSLVNAPTGRIRHTLVWTGSYFIPWGGFDGSMLSSGALYVP